MITTADEFIDATLAVLDAEPSKHNPRNGGVCVYSLHALGDHEKEEAERLDGAAERCVIGQVAHNLKLADDSTLSEVDGGAVDLFNVLFDNGDISASVFSLRYLAQAIQTEADGDAYHKLPVNWGELATWIRGRRGRLIEETTAL